MSEQQINLLTKPETNRQKRLGQRIQLARVSRGLSQRQLAAAICTSQCMVSKYETGQTIPDALMLLAIARALGQKLDYFEV